MMRYKMEKINKGLLLIIGAALFLISYSLDDEVNMFFTNMTFIFFDPVMHIVSPFWIVLFVMIAIPSFMSYKKDKRLIYLLLAAFFLSFAIAFALKLTVARPRPLATLPFPFTSIPDYSFPSIHSIVAFSLLPALIRNLPKQKIFWVAFAVLVGFSRIYLRVHFLSDVVFGAIAGYIIGRFLLELHEKGKLWAK